jgi:hypothetical protein
MSSGRPLSIETLALLGLGSAFAAAGLFMCVAAYNAGQTKPTSTIAIAKLSPSLPPALPPTAYAQNTQPDPEPVFAPAPEPTSVFAAPPRVGPPSPPPRLRIVSAPVTEKPNAPSVVLGAPPEPPRRPIELNPTRPPLSPPASALSPSIPQPSLADIGAKPASLGQYDQFTAVYDLSAHTVYLPGGERLEAHSGLGTLKDDPAHVDEADRGATPPHVYDLTLRESLFHGVQALRLNPLGGSEAIFGRAGLLAHTYLLGPNGDSNGCVSFRNYDAFLQAFQAGRVKRLAVVGSVK